MHDLSELDYHFSLNGRTLIAKNGTRLTYVNALEGRGQLGFAAFYRDEATQRQYLLKQDSLGVCLAEASAVDAFLPEQHRSSINCARLTTIDGQVYSMQPQIQGEKLDQLIFGFKRQARRPISTEAIYSRRIQNFLIKLNPQARTDLACALFASTALGDESVHLGQFMAVSNNGQVERIVRVDFGAKERHAVRRLETNDFFPTKTSVAYAYSGQFGKSYIHYLLQEPKLRGEFLSLWIHVNVYDIVEDQINGLRSQLMRCPEAHRAEALAEFIANINEKASQPIILDHTLPLDMQIDEFMRVYEQIVTWRCEYMKQEARREMKDLLAAKCLNLSKDDQQKLKEFFSLRHLSSETLNRIEMIRSKIKELYPHGFFQHQAQIIHDKLIYFIDAALAWRTQHPIALTISPTVDNLIHKQDEYKERLAQLHLNRPDNQDDTLTTTSSDSTSPDSDLDRNLIH